MSEQAPGGAWSTMMFTRMPARPPRSRVVGLVLALVAIGGLGFSLFADMWLEGHEARLSATVRDKAYLWGPEHDVGFGLRAMSICPEHGDCAALGYGALPAAWPAHLVYLNEVAHGAGEDRARTAAARGREQVVEDLDVGSPATAEEAGVATTEMFHWSGAFIPCARVVLISVVIALVCLVLSAVLVAAGKRGQFPIYPTTPAVLALVVALVAACVMVSQAPGPSGYVGIGPCYWALGVGVVCGILAAIWLSPHLHPKHDDWD